MAPLYILLICLLAALVLIACACGVAGLSPPATRPVDHATVGRGRRRSSSE